MIDSIFYWTGAIVWAMWFILMIIALWLWVVSED
jgi:hypothetical protein